MIVVLFKPKGQFSVYLVFSVWDIFQALLSVKHAWEGWIVSRVVISNGVVPMNV